MKTKILCYNLNYNDLFWIVLCSPGTESEEEWHNEPDILCISALTGEGLIALQEKLYNVLLQNTSNIEKKIQIPMSGEHLRYY